MALGGLKMVSNGSAAQQRAPSLDPAKHVAQAALHVYHALGGGMDVDIYRQCMAEELKQGLMAVEQDVALPLIYRDLKLDRAASADFIVSDSIVVLIRTGGDMKERELELRSLLRLSGKEEGYLFNFRVPDIRKGILHARIKAQPAMQADNTQ
ncbi:MAG: GxxExxY protein [Rhodospirillales bacterium]|nr:GxxExxY protein [Rhodospirillales bacterium]